MKVTMTEINLESSFLH